ncbi:NAD-dependent epimerase/dehydratase family protein (plasmid) [Pseudalkalibacillus hwajinpoensis]|uniref:NAD-dependent epimerase/dehydratase family protein n=1 Tax=Guptibacillus hwajinpoensis TaxID=208199 RepID=UPI00325B382B
MQKEHVVLGTGPLGLAVMEELLKQGKSVRVINKSGKALVPNGVECMKCDVKDLDQLRNSLHNATIIYHCLGLPYQDWQTQFPKMMANIIQVASENGAKIVYGDNLYGYGPQQGPLHEKMPYKPIGKKTKARAEVATTLMEAAKEGKVQATIGRGSDFFGPRAKNAMLGERVFTHLLDEKPVELIGNPDTVHSHIYIKDFARGLIILGDQNSANGEIWHIPHAKPTSTRHLVEQVAHKLNKQPKYRLANKFIVTMGGLFNSDMKEFKELMYQQVNDFTVDSSKFNNKYEFRVTPYEEAIDETIAWYLKEHENKDESIVS